MASNNVTYQDLLAAARKRREQARKLAAGGKSKAEIARLMGVSRQRVQQMLAQA